jgi:hypothetical protein
MTFVNSISGEQEPVVKMTFVNSISGEQEPFVQMTFVILSQESKSLSSK